METTYNTVKATCQALYKNTMRGIISPDTFVNNILIQLGGGISSVSFKPPYNLSLEFSDVIGRISLSNHSCNGKKRIAAINREIALLASVLARENAGRYELHLGDRLSSKHKNHNLIALINSSVH